MSEQDEHDEERVTGSAELDAPGTHYQPVPHRPVRTAGQLTPEERAYNRTVYGVTHRERYGAPAGTCVTYCNHPGPKRRGPRCPSCYGPVAAAPVPTRSPS